MTIRFTPSDPSLEVNGKWTDYHGIKVRICRATKPAFVKVCRENVNGVEIPDDVYASLLAKHILVDWDPATVPGKVPYSVEAAAEVLESDPDFMIFATAYSARMQNFIPDKGKEPLAGESRGLSDGG